MADQLVNHSYTSLSQGVSEQSTEARHETQVEELVNCIPHISRGVMRRNPVVFTSVFRDKDGVALVPADYYVYSYDRGTAGEQYIALIGHRKWYIFNSIGVLKGSYNDANNSTTNLDYLDTNGFHPKDVFSLVTVGDHTWISNNQILVGMSTAADGLSINEHKKIAIHTIKSTGNVTVTTTNVTAGDTVTATPTIEGYTYTLSAHYNDSAYATTLDTATVQANNTYLSGSEIAARMVELLNVGHFETLEAAESSDPMYTYNPMFTAIGGVVGSFRTLFGTFVPAYYVSLNGGKYVYYWEGKNVGQASTTTLNTGAYTYTVSGTAKLTRAGTTYYAIVRTKNAVISDDPLDSLWYSVGPVIYRKDMPDGSTIEYSDSFGNTASYGFKGVVSSSDKLPETLPNDIGEVIVKIDASTETDGGEFWLKWDGEVWSETRAPGLLNYLDHTTMPHTLIRAEDGTFSFGYYGEYNGQVDTGVHVKSNAPRWASREKGDLDSAPEPSFVGRKISTLFLHNNRLGILAEDAVVLSELSAYWNFFPTTVRTIPATDPIDIIVATTDVTGLRKALSLSGALLLFSDQAQFVLTGGGDALTPETAIVSSVSSYNYSYKTPARVLGSRVVFVTESGNGTQLFTMRTDAIVGGTSNVSADNASLHIPTYLPKNINYMISHSILGYMFMLSPDEPTSLYVLNTLELDNQSAQSAFHKWDFTHSILGISVIDNTLNLVMSVGGEMVVGTVSLDVPADVSSVVYSDEYSDGVLTDYNSYITLSKWFLKDGSGYGNRRGRLQIRTALFSVGRLDKYKVEIFNESLLYPRPTDELWILTDAVWNDTSYWSYNATDTDDSTVIWKDALPYFSRVYHDDEKVTVASNSATTYIRFGRSDLDPRRGFTLSTVNLEGLYRQRSQRV